MSKDFYTSVASNVFFPLHEKIKRHTTTAVRRRMEVTQWWNTAQIEELQVSRLRALLTHANAHVPYYRDLFHKNGIEVQTIVSIADLSRLPFLTKAAIRQNIALLKADNAGPLARFNTGGSTGEPLVFYISKERVSHDVAAKWRATRWWDVDIGDREVVVWGSPIELGAQDRMRAARDRVLRTRLLPAFEMSPDKLDIYVARLKTARPAMVFGYPSALARIANHAKMRGVTLADIGTKVVFVTSERLYDQQRADIMNAFGCPVANGYGGRDSGFIAHECKAGGMHITAEDLIVEIVDREGKAVPAGEAGEIVITHLATRDFPFIRYRTGDVAALDKRHCPCGRGLPLLREIEGRTTDFVSAQDGTIMHGLALIYVVRDIAEVSAFKIIQESLELTRVLVVAGAPLQADAVEKIRNGFKARLGQQVFIDIVQVPEIPPEKSGKFRYVVSHVT